MPWFLRSKEDAEIYRPRECPEYSDPDNFTIKLFHGGVFSENSKIYEGGSIDYIDYCNKDEMSLLEVFAMVKECGYGGSMCLWYRLPGTNMERRLLELENDEEILTICTLLPPTKYIEIYMSVTNLLSQEATQEFRSEQANFDFVDDIGGGFFDESTQMEMEQEEELRELFGIYKDFSDPEDYNIEYGSQSGSDDESFYSDHSNLDESDDDLVFEENVDNIVDSECDKADMDNVDDGSSDHSTIYADSDEENMVANSTPNVKVQTGRPKKKRCRKNDIPADPTKLVRENTKNRCKYCTTIGHNSRSCEARKSDEAKKAVAGGVDPTSVNIKSTVQCKTCQKIGHNSRTCVMKKNASNTEIGKNGVIGNENPTLATNASGNQKSRVTKQTVRKKVGHVPRVVPQSVTTERRSSVDHDKGISGSDHDKRTVIKKIDHVQVGSSGTKQGINDVQAEKYTWKGNLCTSLRQLQASKRAKKIKRGEAIN